jgi:hypothetical protein
MLGRCDSSLENARRTNLDVTLCSQMKYLRVSFTYGNNSV